jgi:Asp-tRNA(Asn)/Glu-tRNA(Gln) amidotransferase A subunit family amidase
MSDLLFRPLTEVIGALARRAVSPVELMQETLARIDATQGKLNAFVELRDRERLLEEARAAEERITSGQPRALEGVPLGVKELEDVAGMVSAHGSLPFKDNVAERDSVQVERLRAAGAIVVGKTNAPEFGFTAITKNLIHGVTRSPWNLERTPGGSSGGSSAAISGGVISLATASDGGGSVRLPASFTGCFGLKPSFGRIPNEGDLWVMDDTSVQGPLTRSVEDAALHLDVAVGAHPLDPNSLPHPGLSYRRSCRTCHLACASASLPISATPSCRATWARWSTMPPGSSPSSVTTSRSTPATCPRWDATGAWSAPSSCWGASRICCPSASPSSVARSSRASRPAAR